MLGSRFWVGCGVVLLSATIFTISMVRVFDARALAANSIAATATVTDAREISGANSTRYVLSYDIAYGGTDLSFERSVPEPFYDAHPAGTKWPITIHATRPRIHDLFVGDTRAQIGRTLILSGVALIFGLWLSLSKGVLTRLRARR